jgi:hypothetical protein
MERYFHIVLCYKHGKKRKTAITQFYSIQKSRQNLIDFKYFFKMQTFKKMNLGQIGQINKSLVARSKPKQE